MIKRPPGIQPRTEGVHFQQRSFDVARGNAKNTNERNPLIGVRASKMPRKIERRTTSAALNHHGRGPSSVRAPGLLNARIDALPFVRFRFLAGGVVACVQAGCG